MPQPIVYQARQQIQFSTEVDCKQNSSLHLKQHQVPCHLSHHYQPVQHHVTSHPSSLPLHSHATTIVANSLSNEASYSNSSQFLGSSQDRYIPAHDQQPHHPHNNTASEAYHITQVHSMPQPSHSDLQDHQQQHHQQQQQQDHQQQDHHLCSTSSSGGDGRDRNGLVSGVPHPPPTSMGECEVPTSCHPVGVPASHSQASDQQQQSGPHYGASQAGPSPSQFETQPVSGGVCSPQASSTTVLVHQTDASNPEAVHSYTLTDYQGYSTLLQVRG